MEGIIVFVKSKRIILIPVFIIILIIIVRTIILQKASSQLNYTVTRENLVDTVQVSGTYTTSSQVNVYSFANGVITKLYVKNGNKVQRGDNLFHVESTATSDQQKAAYATYLSATTQLQTDQATLYSLQSTMYSAWKKFTDLATNSTYQNSDGSPNTTNRVLPEFTTAQDDWLSAEALFKNQQNVISKDQAQVASALLTYQETQSVTVTSPASGTITNLLLSDGDQVVASAVTGAFPVLVVANLQNPYINASISEDYAARVSNGQKVSIVFDSLPNQSFQGIVEGVDMVGTDTDGIITYDARIKTSNLPAAIKPNMTAVITIETLRIDNVLDVPNSAIITKNSADYVEDANSHRLIPVVAGTRGMAKTVIAKGVTAGTVIIANPTQ